MCGEPGAIRDMLNAWDGEFSCYALEGREDACLGEFLPKVSMLKFLKLLASDFDVKVRYPATY